MNEQELVDQLKSEFIKAFNNDDRIRRLYGKIKQGKATHKDSAAFSVRAGEILSRILTGNLSQDMFSDGNMSEELAEKILMPLLRLDYEYVAEAAGRVQKNLNQNAGLGLNPVIPKMNVDRAEGIVQKVASYPEYNQGKWVLEEPITNLMQNTVDEGIRQNADFHFKAGLNPVIIRTAERGACKWCRALAGVYDYKDVKDTGNDVFRRHENCRCVVEYDPRDGTRQDVWGKATYRKDDSEARIKSIEDIRHKQEADRQIKLIERKNREEAITTIQREFHYSPKGAGMFYNVHKDEIGKYGLNYVIDLYRNSDVSIKKKK